MDSMDPCVNFSYTGPPGTLLPLWFWLGLFVFWMICGAIKAAKNLD